jgi:hypothetical protein
MHFHVGIDEFGTATQESEGWTIVCLAEPQATALTNEARALLSGGLKSFHGKDFTRKSEGPFRDFLTLLKVKCGESPGSFITCTLNGKSWHEEFTAFAERILEQTFLKAGVAIPELELAMLRQVVSPLFTYLRVAVHVAGEHTATISLDDSKAMKQFNAATVRINGKDFSLPHLAGMLYRAYRKQRFPSSPNVVKDAIQTVPDESSPLIQAADVVGNFSSAYVFNRLGKKSKANDLKAEIFHSVFGEFGIDGIDHSAHVEIVGEDIRLKSPGAYTFAVA